MMCSFWIQKNGFVCGNGVVLQTTNGGDSWNLISSGLQYLSIIQFLNSSTGFISAADGIYKTENAGTNWNKVHEFYGLIRFVNYNTGFSIDRSCYKTTDCGSNWILASEMPGTTGTEGISFMNNSTAFACGNTYSSYYFNFNSQIWRTTDGGMNWCTVYSGAASSFGTFIYAVQCINRSTVYACGNEGDEMTNNFYSSSDAGSTWHFEHTPGLFKTLCFVDQNNGWFAGPLGILYYTSDGGASFAPQQSLVKTDINKVEMVDRNTGWVVGNGGVILKYSNVIGNKNMQSGIPKDFELYQNYPNPFNPSTNIKFSIAPPLGLPLSGGEAEGVRLTVYNILGRETITLVKKSMQPGTYEVKWDASKYPSGVYFYKLETSGFVQTKKMILMK